LSQTAWQESPAQRPRVLRTAIHGRIAGPLVTSVTARGSGRPVDPNGRRAKGNGLAAISAITAAKSTGPVSAAAAVTAYGLHPDAA
jgi:hypothetical protein